VPGHVCVCELLKVSNRFLTEVAHVRTCSPKNFLAPSGPRPLYLPSFPAPLNPLLPATPFFRPHHSNSFVFSCPQKPKNIRLNSWHVVIKAFSVCVCVCEEDGGRGTSSSFKRSKIRLADYCLLHSKKIYIWKYILVEKYLEYSIMLNMFHIIK